MAGIGFMVLLVVGVVIGLVALERRRRTRKLAALKGATTILEGSEVDEEKSTVTGKLEGLPVELRFVVRGSGKQAESWTEVDVETRPLPLLLDIRRATHVERRYVERGLAMDVQTGALLFDERFIIEAAPADVARKLLDETVRELLLGLGSYCRLTYSEDGGRMRLEEYGWALKPGEAKQLIQITTELAGRLSTAFTEADRDLAVESGSPYRAAMDVTGAREARAAREQERAQLADIQAARKTHIRNVGRVWMGLFIFGLVVLVVWAVNS